MSASAIVNQEQCRKTGNLLKNFRIRPGFLAREFIKVEADRETKLRMYLMASAICHQTHHLFHNKLNLWGWDFLEYGFLKMLKSGSAIFNPGYICMVDQAEIAYYLQKTFSPDGVVGNSTLDRLPERVEMLVEICKIVKENNRASVAELIDGCKGRLLNNGKGLYEILSRFKAFSDPYRKKITFFLKLATDAGLIRIMDPENIIPIMDYHMQRVFLRMGCIEITNKRLKSDLTSKKKMASDEVVRTAAIEAVKIIAGISGHSILSINDYFWSLGRSCCNETKLCVDGLCMKQPCTFYQMVELDKHDYCIFEGICLGSCDPSYRELWEPVVDTHFY